MSPQGKRKSKSTRSTSADRSAKSKKGGPSTAPLWIAGLLIGAIAVAMGYTIHKQSHAARPVSDAPQAAPESGVPVGTDPGATQANPGTPTQGTKGSQGASQNQNQGGGSSQVLTN